MNNEVQELSDSKIRLMTQAEYNGLISKIGNYNRSCLKQQSIANDISNLCLMKLVKKGEDTRKAEGYIDRNYAGIVEKYFSDLYFYSYRYCLSKIKHNEASEDIAQETIISLLKAESQITYIKPWVRQVTANNIINYFKQREKEQLMNKAIEAEYKYLDSLQSGSEPEDLSEELIKQVPEMAKHPHYIILKEIDSFPTLREYAEAKKITYDAAKKQRQELRHNLRAFYLRMIDWKASPEILSYNEVRAMQSLIRQLINSPKNGEKPKIRKNSSLMKREDILQVFDDFVTVESWDVVLVSANKYRVHIAGYNPDKELLCSSIIVKVTEKGRFMVESCKRNKLATVFDISPKMVLPLEKGKVCVTFEQMKALIKGDNQIKL